MSEDDKETPSKKLLKLLKEYSSIIALISALVAFFTRQVKLPPVLTYLIVAVTYSWIAWELVRAIRSEAVRAKLPFQWLKSRGMIVVLLIGISLLVSVWFGYYGWVDYQATLPTVLPREEGEILVIISDFENLPTKEGLYIYRKISEPIAKLKQDESLPNPKCEEVKSELPCKEFRIRIGRLQGDEIINDVAGARNWLEQADATLVIWGWHIRDTFEPHMLVSPVINYEEGPEDYTNIDLDLYPFLMNSQMAESYEFLTSLAISRVLYAWGDKERALWYVNQALNPELISKITDEIGKETWGKQFAYYTRGDVQGALGNVDNAIDDYLGALKLDDNFSEAYNNLGNYYASKGDAYFEDAKESYEKAIIKDLPVAYYNLGNLYAKHGDACHAMESYDKAADKLESPLDALKNYYNRGALQMDLGNYRLAFADFNEAIRYAPVDRDDLLSTYITQEQR